MQLLYQPTAQPVGNRIDIKFSYDLPKLTDTAFSFDLVDSSDGFITTVPAVLMGTSYKLVVSNASTAINIGATAQLTAAATDAQGNPKTLPSNLVWASSDAAIATVDSSGLVTAIAAGTASITVAHEGYIDGIAMVSVNQIQLTITPKNPSVIVGGTRQLAVTAIDSLGNPLTVPSNLQWISSNTSVATVDSTGLVTGVAEGIANLRVADPESGVTVETVVTVILFACTGGGSYIAQGGLTWTPNNCGHGSTYGYFSWTEADAYCAGGDFQKLTGWRLPTKDELIALGNSGALVGQGSWLGAHGRRRSTSVLREPLLMVCTTVSGCKTLMLKLSQIRLQGM
jgi:hypothetical protein